jgi:uncharacterized protein
MDVVTLDLAVFLGATFVAALVAGLAGFAFGLVAAAAWLHVLTPLQTASLIIAFGLIVQGVAVWKLRRALQWGRLWPFLIGGLVGVPIGVALLRWANPDAMRAGIGVLLVLYSIHGLVRPAMKPIDGGGAPADAGVGVLNGILGGATGLAGIIVTVWCGLRGWPRDAQRAVFQPIGVSVFAMSAVVLGASGSVDAETVRLFAIGLPILLAGTWLGLRLYGHLDEAGFRKVVLALLLVSGAALVVPLRPNGAAAEEKFQKLNGGQIRAKLAGMELTDGVHWRDLYERNGTASSMSMGSRRTGKWRIDKDQFCIAFEKEPIPKCYDVWLSGRQVELRREGLLPLQGMLEPPSGRK